MVRLKTFPRHFSWRLVRWLVIGLSLPLVLMAILLSLTIWRLEQNPLEVTSLVQYWQPVALKISKDQPPIGHIRWRKTFLSWTPHRSHLPAGVMLKAAQLELVQTDGRVVDRLQHVEAVLNIAALFRGHLAFRAVRIAGAEFTLKRYKDGTITPDIVGYPYPSTSSHSAPVWSFLDGDALRSVDITHLAMTMVDEQRPQEPLQFHMPSLQMKYYHVSGWSGHMEGALHWGKTGIPFQINVQPTQQKKTHFSLHIGSFIPADLTQWLPNIKEQDAARWQFPIKVTVEGDVVPEGMGGRPVELWTDFLIGQGEIIQPGHSSLVVQHGHARFDVKWQSTQPLQHIALEKGQFDLTLLDSQKRPVSITSSAQITIDDLMHPKSVGVEVQAHMPQFDFATLSSIWPRGPMKGARRWMTENMPKGQGQDLYIDAHLHSEDGFRDLNVTSLKGHLQGHNLDVHWLRPVQPVTGLDAYAYFLNPDTLEIDVKNGTLSDGQHGNIAVPKGEITLTGLMKEDQYADIKLDVEGVLPSFLSVLSHPRLRLLSRYDLGIRRPAGKIKGTLSVNHLWLDQRVEIGDIGFGAMAQFQDLALEFPDIGAIKQGQGSFRLSEEDLRLQGKATIHGFPVDLSIMESFRANEAGRVLRHITARTWLNNERLASLGLILPSDILSGAAPVSAEYVQKGLGNTHRQSDLRINVDLTPVSINIASWVKPKNSASSLEGRAHLFDNHLQSFDHILLTGPSLTASGQAMIKGHRISGLSLDHIVFRRNKGRVQFLWPLNAHDSTPYQVDVHAETLDVSPWLHSRKEAEATTSKILAQPQKEHSIFPDGTWRVALQAQHLLYTQERAMANIRAQVDWSHHVLSRAGITVAAPAPFSMNLVTLPGENPKHKINADISNIGVLLKDIELYQHMSAGHVRLDGVFSGVQKGAHERVGWGLGLGSFSGHIKGENIALSDTPPILTVAKLLSPPHWGQLSHKRFDNIKAAASLYLNNEKMTITDGHMSNAILGGTIEGLLDFKESQLALTGTVSPFFYVNHAVGNIFGARSFLAPEVGSGIAAITYKLNGTFAQPSFKINLFSMLLPGALRHLLK